MDKVAFDFYFSRLNFVLESVSERHRLPALACRGGGSWWIREGGIMRVNEIIPCICSPQDDDESTSCYYGMPQLKVTSYNGRQLYEAFCPHCGRGGLFQFKSSYYALKDWNKLQEDLRNPIIFV